MARGQRNNEARRPQKQGGVIKAGGNAIKQQGGYAKIPGTQIQHLNGGEVVRVVNASGKTFGPNDIQGVTRHLENFASTSGQASPRGQTGNRNGGQQQKYEKVPGTQIRNIDGRTVRVVEASGATFEPNDMQGLMQHLEKLLREGKAGGNAGKQQSGKGGNGRQQSAKAGNQGAGKRQGGNGVQAQYERVKGTQVKTVNGQTVREVNASGMLFAVNDISGARSHMDKLRRSQQPVGGSNARKRVEGRGKGAGNPQMQRVKKQNMKQRRTPGNANNAQRLPKATKGLAGKFTRRLAQNRKQQKRRN